MEVPNVSVGTVEAPQTTTVNMKGRMQEEISQEETSPKLNEDPKEALTNPMETVGRSMVNFKGIQHLSAKDLNYLAQKMTRNNATLEETAVLKEALVKTMNNFRKTNIKGLTDLCAKDTDKCIDVHQAFVKNVTKVDPNADVDRIALLFAAV